MCLNFRSTRMFCHALDVKVGPTCLNCCPTSTTAMKTQFQEKMPCNQGLVVAHGGSWARGWGGKGRGRGVTIKGKTNQTHPSASIRDPRSFLAQQYTAAYDVVVCDFRKLGEALWQPRIRQCQQTMSTLAPPPLQIPTIDCAMPGNHVMTPQRWTQMQPYNAEVPTVANPTTITKNQPSVRV